MDPLSQVMIQRPENSSFLPQLAVDEDKELTGYVLRLKIAVAVAIIRSTPKHMSPKTYAQTLVNAFSSDIDALRAKCQKLEQDVFCLEQKMAAENLKEKAISLCPSIDLLLAPIRETSILESRNFNNEFNSSFRNTIDFVRSFILLDSVSSTCSRSSVVKEDSVPKVNGIILKSIANLLDFIRSDEGLKMEFHIVKQSIDEVHHLFNMTFGKFNPDLVQICLNFVDGLLLDIHRKIDLNKMDDHHRRSTLIQMMGEHKSLTVLILCRLLREITVIADFLWSVYRKGNVNYLPLLHAENVYYVLQSTEGLVNIMRRQDSQVDLLKIPKTLLAEWEETLEKSLSSLGMHFPMFCIYVWHLKSLLKTLFEGNRMAMELF